MDSRGQGRSQVVAEEDFDIVEVELDIVEDTAH